MYCVPVLWPPPDDESPPAYRARSRRNLLWCVLVCVACAVGASVLHGQEPSPTPPTPAATLKIAGKATAAIGEELRLPIEGLKSPDVSGGLKPVVDWSGRIRVLVDGPDKSQPLVEPDMLLGLGAEAVRIRLNFIADSGGVYVLILHDGNSGAIATKRITVGPVVPTPNPPPGPGPGPSPGPQSIKKVVLVYEKDQSQVLPSLRAALHSLNVDGSGVVASIVEIDSTNGGGAVPAQFVAAVKAAKEAGLPALVSLNGADVVFRLVKNPTTEAHVREVLGK